MSPFARPSEVNPAASARTFWCSCAYVIGAGVRIAVRSGVSRAQRSSQSVRVASTALSIRHGKQGLRARETTEQIEHPLAPCGERVFRFKDFERADDTRPLEQTEQDIVRVRGVGAGQERLRAHHGARRIEQLAKSGDVLVARGGEL